MPAWRTVFPTSPVNIIMIAAVYMLHVLPLFFILENDRSYGGVNENQLPLDSYCLCGFAVIRLDLGVLVVSRASSWEKQAGCRVETEDKLSSRKLCYLSYGNNLLRNWLPLHFFLLNVLQIPLLLNSNQEPYREEDLGKHSFQASIHSLHILPLKDSQIYIA